MYTEESNKLAEIDYQNMEVFEGMPLMLERSLKQQKKKPHELIETGFFTTVPRNIYGEAICQFIEDGEWNVWHDKSYTMDQLTGLNKVVSNCELDAFNGTSPFGDVVNTDLPSLQMKLSFWECEPLHARFLSLPCAHLFTVVRHETTEGDVLLQYFINCEENVQLMAAVYTMILTQLYAIDLHDIHFENFQTCESILQGDVDEYIRTKQELYEVLQTKGMATKIFPLINFRYLIKPSSVEELDEFINLNNEKFIRKVHERYEFDKSTRLLTVCNIEDNHSKSKFFGALKGIGQVFQISSMWDLYKTRNTLLRTEWKY